MKSVVYGETKVMTGDAIAEAVLAYAAALGENGTTDIVEVPTFDAAGCTATAQLLLGPASQVLIEVAPDDELEPENDDLVNELTRRTEAVGGARSSIPRPHTRKNQPPSGFEPTLPLPDH